MPKTVTFLNRLSVALGLCGLVGSGLLSGCALNDTVSAVAGTGSGVVAAAAGPSLTGVVHGGQTPISGSLVQLWQTSTNGYGVKATTQLVASTTTAVTTGSFTFPTSNVPANCTAGSFAYLTATGGDSTGNTTSNLNPAIVEVAMLGSCASVGASTFVTINEITTAAAAFALSGFSTDSAGVVGIGTSSTNVQGLKDAVANAALLASSTYGTATASTATMLMPTATLTTLADVAATCVNTSSSTSSGCTTLFGLTTPPGKNAVAPTDIFQALLNLAAYPGNNVNSLVALVQGTGAAFQTALVNGNGTTTAVNDLTLGIVYLNNTLNGAATAPGVLTLDASDDVWVLGAATSASNYVSELTSPSAGVSFTNGLASAVPAANNVRWGAFDTSNNLWLSNGATPLEVFEVPNGVVANAAAQTFTSLGTGNTTTGAATLDPNNYVVAIDASGDVFTATYGGVGNCVPASFTSTTVAPNVCDAVELVKSGATYTPTDQFGSGSAYVSVPSVRGIFADANAGSAGKGNVWYTNYGQISTSGPAKINGVTNPSDDTTPGNFVQVLTPSSGNVNTITVGGTGDGLWGIALDSTGGAYVLASTVAGLYYVPQGTANAVSISSTVGLAAIAPAGIATTATAPASSASVAVTYPGYNVPSNTAVDGAGNVWVANSGYNTLVEYNPNYIPVSGSGTGAYLSPFYGFSPTVTPTTISIYAYAVTTGGVASLYTGVPLTPGQTVTLSGFTTSKGTFLNGQTVTVLTSTTSKFTANVTGYNTTTAVSKTTDTGVGTPSTGQEYFTCSGTSTITCGVVAGAMIGETSVAIDYAGSVWTVSGNGNVLEMIGTAAPSNPVMAAGGYGVKP